MERALSSGLLEVALEGLESLPSPGALAAQLENAQIRLLTGRDADVGALIPTAWWLHAVGTARPSRQLYTVDQQRSCFAVSGHIFDLALRSRSLGLEHRLEFCVAAQIAFLRSELTANTIAVFRREFREPIEPFRIAEKPGHLSLLLAAKFLAMQAKEVWADTGKILNDFTRSLEEWGLAQFHVTPFAASYLVCQGVRGLQRYLSYGDSEALASARDALRSAIDNRASNWDRTSRWVAAHLLDLGADLEQTSLWNALPPEVPKAVRQAFAKGRPNVMTLWPPQVALLGKADIQGRHMLSPDSRRMFVSTPTSSGKTLFAQLLIATHIATKSTDVCYVAPTRSLCREVTSDLEARLDLLDVDIYEDTNSFGPTSSASARVEVMTPERLSYLLRGDSQAVLSRFGLFVFDEVHNVDDSDRGWTLESDLAFLHYVTRDTEHRILIMSAVVGNQLHFTQWLSFDESQPLTYSHDWRATRRILGAYRVKADSSSASIVPAAGNRLARRKTALRGELVLRSQTGQAVRLPLEEPVGVRTCSTRDGETWKNIAGESTPNYQAIVPLALDLGNLGPVLLIFASKPQVRRAAVAISDALEPLTDPSDGLQELIGFAEQVLGEEHSLPNVLKHGVAYHHAGLPREVRERVEDGVRHGEIRFLVATTTLTEGVNLPVKSVFICEQRFGGSGEDFVAGARLMNAIGRAGRSAMDTEGIVVLAKNGNPSRALRELEPAPHDLIARSALATDQALRDLASYLDKIRAAADRTTIEAGKSVRDFLSFVWFVAFDGERAGRQIDEEQLEGLLGSTLAWSQLGEAQRREWLSVALDCLDEYYQTPIESRQRWGQTGTSLTTARKLEAVFQEILDASLGHIDTRDPTEQLWLLLGNGRLKKLLDLDEAPEIVIGPSRLRERIHAGQAALILSDWLEGLDFRSIADSRFAEFEDAEQRAEYLTEVVTKWFETYLPWVLATLITWVNEHYPAEVAGLDSKIPLYVRWGVPSEAALELLMQGVRSRRLAIAIASHFSETGGEGAVLDWLANLPISALKGLLAPSDVELRDLLNACRAERVRIAGKLLAGEEVRLELGPQSRQSEPAKVTVEFAGDEAMASIAVFADGNMVSEVPAWLYLDLAGILEDGSVITGWIEPASSKLIVRCRVQERV